MVPVASYYRGIELLQNIIVSSPNSVTSEQLIRGGRALTLQPAVLTKNEQKRL